MKRSAQINLCPYDNSFLRYVYMPWSVNNFFVSFEFENCIVVIPCLAQY